MHNSSIYIYSSNKFPVSNTDRIQWSDVAVIHSDNHKLWLQDSPHGIPLKMTQTILEN